MGALPALTKGLVAVEPLQGAQHAAQIVSEGLRVTARRQQSLIKPIGPTGSQDLCSVSGQGQMNALAMPRISFLADQPFALEQAQGLRNSPARDAQVVGHRNRQVAVTIGLGEKAQDRDRTRQQAVTGRIRADQLVNHRGQAFENVYGLRHCNNVSPRCIC